jgi:hypothetical protein
LKRLSNRFYNWFYMVLRVYKCLFRHHWTTTEAFYEPNGPIRFICLKCGKKTEIYWPAMRLVKVSSQSL